MFDLNKIDLIWWFKKKNESIHLKITVYPYFLQNIPKIISFFPYKFIVIPALESYLKSVIGGINYYLKTKKIVPKNYFGEHKWFSWKLKLFGINFGI